MLRLRLGDRIPRRRRRVLDRYLEAERSPLAWGWLLARSFRSLLGRNETLAVERGLLRGIALAPAAADRRPAAGVSRDTAEASADLAEPPTRSPPAR